MQTIVKRTAWFSFGRSCVVMLVESLSVIDGRTLIPLYLMNTDFRLWWVRSILVGMVWLGLAAFVGQAQTVPPYTTDFEAAGGYSAGNLNSQDGWSVLQGAGDVTSSLASSGANSVSLTFSSGSAQITHAFGQGTGVTVTFLDFFLRPSVDTTVGSSTTLDAEGSRLGFVSVSTDGHVMVFNGDGASGGTWEDTGHVVALNGSGQATSWVRLTIRQDYMAKRWDLYIDGVLVRHDLGFLDDTKAYLSAFTLISAPLATGYFDDMYVGDTNPLFTDADGDGMDDTWETTYGLSTATDDREGDADGDSLSNIEEYLRGTDPTNADTDGDGVRDDLEIALGSDPLVADATSIPGLIDGLVLHLKADAGVTVDGSGNVSSWLDQAQSLTADQSSSGNRPALVTSSLNGYPVVRFDGSSSYLNLPNFLSSLTGAELIVVLKASSSSNSDARLFSFLAGGGTTYPSSSGVISDGFGFGTTFSYGVDGADLTQARLYDVSVSSGNWLARLDGKPLFEGTGSATFANGSYTPLIGADHSGPYYSLASWFGGDVAEIIIYDHPLTPIEREAVGYYLTSKYALSISAPSAPTDFNATVLSSTSVSLVWDGASSTDYTLERYSLFTGWQAIATLTGQTCYTDTGLTPGTNYEYRLKAENFAGVSSSVGPVYVTTFAADIADGMDTSGIRLWLKPESLLQGPNGIGYWPDLGGAGNNALQTNTANRPSVSGAAVSGFPAVHFDGSNAYMNLPQVMNSATEGEVFVVLKGSTSAGSILFSYLGQSASTTYPSGTDQISDGFGSTSNYSFSSSGHDLTDPHIYSVAAATDTWAASLDGGILQTSSSNTVNFTDHSFNPILGAARNGAYYSYSNFFNGDVSEVLIYDHRLTVSERYAVGVYLNRKYDLGIPAAPTPSDFQAAVISPTKISLWWNTSASCIYLLERSSAAGPWTSVAVIEGQTSYTDTGLDPDTEYSYRLEGISFGGPSEYTDSVTVRTLDTGQMEELPTSGLQLWLRPESLIASGSGIGQWNDESGQDHHATQTSTGNQPSVVLNAINGQPAVSFDGTSSYLDLPNFLGSATAAEVFVVLTGSTTADSCLFSYFGNSGGTFYPGSSGQISDGFGSTSNYTFNPIGADLENAHLYNVSTKSGGWSAYLDGIVAKQSDTNSVNLTDSGFAPLIGAARGGAYYSKSNFFSGKIAEILIYDRELTPLERESVNFYLNQRYHFSVQSFNNLNAFAYDSDGDGLSNAKEAIYGTNALNPDSDGDGMPDNWEILHSLNPLSDDALADADGDGVSNLDEYLRGTDPQVIEANDPAASVQLKVFQPARN